MASTAFSKALDKRKNAAKLLDKANKAEVGGDFSTPDIPADEYLARVKGSCGVTPKQGVPYVEFKWTIADGEYKGKGYRETFYLEDKDPEREEKTWNRLGKTLKVLSTRDVVTFEDFEELAAVVGEIDDETPLCKIKTTRWQTKKDKEAEAESGVYVESGLGCFFNKRVEVQQDEPADGEASDEGPKDTAVGPAFKKDDPVIFDGEEYVVVTSSVRYETCTIKSVDDPNNRHKDIAWAELELLQ